MNVASSLRLYLLPNSIGSSAAISLPDSFVTPLMRQVCDRVKLVFAEDMKSARKLFRACGYTGDFSEIEIILLNEHSKYQKHSDLIDVMMRSGDAAIVSDAGIPCVADPGSGLVSLAHQHGIEVVPISGPSSILLTLAASGLNGQRFTFNGYLPKGITERRKYIREMELSAAKGYTQIFMDTPYRNMQVLEDLFAVCRKDLLLCIGCEVTTQRGFVNTMRVGDWMKKKPELNKRPVIFALGAAESIL
jgi:16S rRNA (cytidine1402-2'-O)-methyltransferase